jgi:4-amino-4-deoxy-L-arabinose transferase-like glycosyltransferase
MIAPSKFAKIFLLVFACAHIAFALTFAIKTPYRTPGVVFMNRKLPTSDVGAPDERQHANYIRFLLKQHALPVLVPGAPNVGEEYESHQPPLYYILSGIPAAITGQTDPENQSFGRTIRILNCLIGAFGIVGTFFAVLWATNREDIALVGTAFAALLPMNCALSGTISNDPLLIALISWSFAFCAKALGTEEGKDAAKPFLIAAIFAGLACLTKSTGLVAIAGLAATALYLRPRLPMAKVAGIALVSCLIAAPIWIRNQMLYGDPLAQKVFKEAFTGSAQKSAIITQIEGSNSAGSPEVQYWINWVGYWTARSYVGVFGVMDIWLNGKGGPYDNDPNWLYKAILAFIALAKLAFWVDVRNRYKDIPKAIWVGLVVAVLTVMLFIGFNMTYFQAQGRYLLPCLAPTAAVLGIGWMLLFRSKLVPALILVSLVFGGTTIYALSNLSQEFEIRTTMSK